VLVSQAQFKFLAMVSRRCELREWNASHSETVADSDYFGREILPALESIPLSDLARATGLSLGVRLADPARQQDAAPASLASARRRREREPSSLVISACQCHYAT
jgi:hypothetical protein